MPKLAKFRAKTNFAVPQEVGGTVGQFCDMNYQLTTVIFAGTNTRKMRNPMPPAGLVLLVMYKMIEEKCDAYKAKGILDYRKGKPYETAVKDN